MNVVESKFDSDVFGYKVGKLEVHDKSDPGFVRVPFDVVFVRLENLWRYPAGDVQALDHRYEMGLLGKPSPFSSHSWRVAKVQVKSDRLKEIARASFIDSRFFRDPALAGKAEQLYVRWLEASENCWVLSGFENEAFLLQTWDDPFIARVSLIAVDRGLRGRGLGRKLLEGVLSQVGAQGWRVCVSAGNLKALELYASVGFRVLSSSTVYHVWI